MGHFQEKRKWFRQSLSGSWRISWRKVVGDIGAGQWFVLYLSIGELVSSVYLHCTKHQNMIFPESQLRHLTLKFCLYLCLARRYIVDERSYNLFFKLTCCCLIPPYTPHPLHLKAQIYFSHGVEIDLMASGGGGELIPMKKHYSETGSEVAFIGLWES